MIATTSQEDHEKAVADLTLNPRKCKFLKEEIPFWGMIILGSGVRPDPRKVEALREATHPE